MIKKLWQNFIKKKISDEHAILVMDHDRLIRMFNVAMEFIHEQARINNNYDDSAQRVIGQIRNIERGEG